MPTTRTTDRSPPPPREQEKQRREGEKLPASPTTSASPARMACFVTTTTMMATRPMLSASRSATSLTSLPTRAARAPSASVTATLLTSGLLAASFPRLCSLFVYDCFVGDDNTRPLPPLKWQLPPTLQSRTSCSSITPRSPAASPSPPLASRSSAERGGGGRSWEASGGAHG
ncbi:Os01g0162600 [Oryza sativa Japonica Group]|uniref:Os01g0162600 protein n=1 Tax=Oryza sativa subsp. japonica TaxID=39947 RepID=A0A0P0UYP0_ORYSJ|nr:Os01g0162600 [Oryza sativa Japonica Group]